MPVVQLTEGQKTNLSSWTIIGSIREGIVFHVAILAKDVNNVKPGDKIPVHHMGPPMSTIVSSSGLGNEDSSASEDFSDSDYLTSETATVHVAACLEDLSEDEKKDLRRWYGGVREYFPEANRPKPFRPRSGQEDKLVDFLKKSHYIAHPPIKKDHDPITKNLKAIWYSCAGFVLDCFENTVAKKLLLSWEDSSFPKVCEDKIQIIWCNQFNLTLTPELKDALGLLGEGPWPVVMPGYIVNTFERHADEIRNVPFVPTVHHIAVN